MLEKYFLGLLSAFLHHLSTANLVQKYCLVAGEEHLRRHLCQKALPVPFSKGGAAS